MELEPPAGVVAEVTLGACAAAIAQASSSRAAARVSGGGRRSASRGRCGARRGRASSRNRLGRTASRRGAPSRGSRARHLSLAPPASGSRAHGAGDERAPRRPWRRRTSTASRGAARSTAPIGADGSRSAGASSSALELTSADGSASRQAVASPVGTIRTSDTSRSSTTVCGGPVTSGSASAASSTRQRGERSAGTRRLWIGNAVSD